MTLPATPRRTLLQAAAALLFTPRSARVLPGETSLVLPGTLLAPLPDATQAVGPLGQPAPQPSMTAAEARRLVALRRDDRGTEQLVKLALSQIRLAARRGETQVGFHLGELGDKCVPTAEQSQEIVRRLERRGFATVSSTWIVNGEPRLYVSW